MIQLNEKMIEKLGYKGVLAYVAVSYAGSGVYTAALLASTVQTTTTVMRDGLQELAVHHPLVVQWLQRDRKWKLGGEASEGGQIVEAESERRKNLIDDIKKFWEHLNPKLPFPFSGPDGVAVSMFLKRNREWTRGMWQTALNNRGKSVVNKSEPVYRWMSRLENYIGGPLDHFGKPMTNGGGKLGKAIDVEQSNRAAREAVAGSSNRV